MYHCPFASFKRFRFYFVAGSRRIPRKAFRFKHFGILTQKITPFVRIAHRQERERETYLFRDGHGDQCETARNRFDVIRIEMKVGRTSQIS